MNPVSHFLISWVIANTGGLQKRERAAVVAAGIVPDVDGLGIVAEKLTQNWEEPLLWWSDYHHVLGHNLGFGLLVTLCCALAVKQRLKTAALAFVAFHVHLFCDIVGARGPDGDQWPIPYLLPFRDALQITWSHQWPLNAWPNFVITGAALAVTFYLAAGRGFSPLEMVSANADRAFVDTLRRRLGISR